MTIVNRRGGPQVEGYEIRYETELPGGLQPPFEWKESEVAPGQLCEHIFKLNPKGKVHGEAPLVQGCN